MMRTGAFGDYYTAFASASGVCAALVGRQATGEGQLVSTSLLRTGAFCDQRTASTRCCSAIRPSGQRTRTQSFNPMISCYRDSKRNGSICWGCRATASGPRLRVRLAVPNWSTIRDSTLWIFAPRTRPS